MVHDAAAIDAGPAKKTFVTGAGRCGECHSKMYDEWEVSAHAKAATSELYKATVAAAKDPTCDRCHAPLPTEIVRTEGVTCDVCHTLREPVPSDAGGSFRLAIDDMVKYGPRCDLKDHYFHRMGCSPEHREAALCGACHLWKPNGIPVFTEYEDWKAGPAGQKGEPCQDCHMPKERAALATGSPVRTGVPHHGLLGLAKDLRGRALGLDVTVREDAGKLAIAVTVKNTNAGHTVPSGLPEHRLLVIAQLVDASGGQIAVDKIALGRVLVDDTGAEVPFWRAKKVGSDTRIAPGGQWQGTLSLPSATAGEVKVDVVYRGVSETISKQLALTTTEEHEMVGAKIPLGKLPRSVTVAPPAAGKRPGKAIAP